MAKTIDDYIPGEWERCPDCGLYDPEQLLEASALMNKIAQGGIEELINQTAMDAGSLIKLQSALTAYKEIDEGQYCGCAFPHAINRYRLFDQSGKYIRVTSTT
jgi:hypothetical protein|tara:strand:+ start:83 stop:391 length:309 start_codon:yes stop_codon:yes gene_type:complete